MALNGQEWQDPNTARYIQELERIIRNLESQVRAQAALIQNLQRRR